MLLAMLFRIFKILSSLEKRSGNAFKQLSGNAEALAFTLLKCPMKHFLRIFEILMNGIQMLRKHLTTFSKHSDLKGVNVHETLLELFRMLFTLHSFSSKLRTFQKTHITFSS